MMFKLIAITAILAAEPVIFQLPGDTPGDETEAQRVSHTRSSLDQGREALASLQKRIDDPNGEYTKAEIDFQLFDKKVTQLKQMIAKQRADGKYDEAQRMETELGMVQIDWQLARNRFDLAIRERKAMQEAIAGLKVRIAKDQEQLDRLEGRTPATQPATNSSTKSANSSTDAKSASPTGLPTMSGLAVSQAAPATPSPTPDANRVPEEKKVRHARHKLEMAQADQRESEAAAKTAKAQVHALEQSLRTMAKILKIEEETAVEAHKAATHLLEVQQQQIGGDDKDQAAARALRLSDALQREKDAQERAAKISERIASMNEMLKELKEELTRAIKDVEDKRTLVDTASSELADLLSPFAWSNIVKWLTIHGPKLLLIACGMIALHFIVRQISRHIVRFAALNAARGTIGERENRASTLIGVFRYAATMAIFGGGSLMLLDEAGIPIIPLMGGAAVFGLAAAFGAQNLIRDYFTGFMMLMEDQYSVNDVIRIGAVSGLVEKITLRMTVLRDLEGIRHFIPHGSVTGVSNMTHGWSRALFDISVPYFEDVDRVINVLRELSRELQLDSTLGKFIIEEPEMLGVQSISNSQVVIRFLIKTRPLQQWPVRREMLRRIKKRFADLGISMPGVVTSTAPKSIEAAAEPIPFPSLSDRAAG